MFPLTKYLSRTRYGRDMRIHVATDHAGLDFSQNIQTRFRELGYDVIDHGPKEYDALDDYPAFCINAARAVAKDQSQGVAALGIVFGGSGNGEQIAANKVEGIRAALVWNKDTAVLAREHNDANVISIGARQHTYEEALELIELFVNTPFPGEERHTRRVAQMAEYERTGDIQDKGIV